MGRTSAKRKAGKGKSVHYGSATSQECSHENTDVRLQRRLKRRCTDHQSFNPNSHSSATSVQLGSLGSGDNDSDLSLRRNGNSYSAEFVDENGVTNLIDYDVEDDLRPSMRFGSENQLPAFAEDVDEDDSKHVDEDDLEDVDVEDLEDVDEEYFLTFLNNRNEYSYITPVSRDKEDDADHCRFIKLKPSQPSGHSNLKHGGTIGNPNLKRGLAADCEQEDGEIEYLTYLDTIEDYENTSPKKSDKVEEIELGDEYDQEDEGDGICEDYHAFLDCLEKEDIDNPTLAKDGDRSQSQSRFRKELLEILRSPYDPQQHIELWAEVSHRKRKVKDIMLWGGTKSSNLEDSLGESLLDRYKEFVAWSVTPLERSIIIGSDTTKLTGRSSNTVLTRVQALINAVEVGCD
uniref:Uncharacterized protein n=1 Tax=Cannabis sativa TaxID=3483 RepID=A0A803Q3B2_CANSA